MHRELSDLERGLDLVRGAPTDQGRVELIIRRPADDERDVLTEVHLDLVEGVPGDVWLTEDGDLDRQVTVMNVRAATLIAGSIERRALAGDNLYVDLDISTANLPVGSRLQFGQAVLEVSPAPHRGCKKFGARFGLDALRFVNSPVGYSLRLRGLNARVVQAGTLRAGDVVRVLSRATVPQASTVDGAESAS